MKSKISKSQYERAKRIVEEYESNLRSAVHDRTYTIDDLEILLGSIAIPYLTSLKVDESYAATLTEKLEEAGFNIDYVSLDDLGFIVVRYRGYGGKYNVQITDHHINSLLAILNSKF